ncbi:PAS domain-containing sensor histidine kinase [Myxococcus xanthus]|uniref:sensor histidine kinase n=1 Tax=Myxococcus xanthus TaxID=34 RepID=UPI00112E10BF|nr:ATP-binding protein [Myxococcus xanthus]QDE88008.1 PAS domain-containing sensor histidine kinase [Myxococcus xanthus]
MSRDAGNDDQRVSEESMASGIDELSAWLDAAVDPFVACDAGENVCFLNAAAERLLGWTREELIGQPASRLFPQRLHRHEGESLLRHLLSRRTALGGRATRVLARRKDGAEIMVELTVGASGKGRDERIVLNFRRLHEVVDTLAEPVERALHGRESESVPGDALFRAVVEHAPLGIIYFDLDAIVIACNELFVSIIGSPKRLMVGLNLLSLRDEGILHCVRETLAGHTCDYEGEYRAITSGKKTPVHIRFAPCFNAAGQVEGGIGIVEDISERRRAERERERLYREAQEAIRVRDDFLSIASHELKTPLTPLSLRLATLERRLARGELVESSTLRQARLYLLRITSLINDLLDSSRIEAGRLALHREATRLEGLVEHVLHELEPQRGNHTVRFDAPEQPVQVNVDPFRMEQVLANLVENAFKYSPNGGTVRVSLRQRGGLALLSVSDEGIGIPPDQQKLLFDRYFRARNASAHSFGGLGLGLYISRDIVERHGGRIWVESEPGHGSTFHVALPLMAGAPAQPNVEEPGQLIH